MSLTKVSYSLIQSAPVNVVDFGADPTGVADSSAAIQAAIDYAFDNSLSLQTSGTFKITSTIYIKQYYPTSSLLNRASTSVIFNGKFIVDGCLGFIVVGNNTSIHFDKVIAQNNASIIKYIDCGYSEITFNDMIGNGSSGDGITGAGSFDLTIQGQSLIGFNKCIALRKSNSGDSFTSPFTFTAQNFNPNNPVITVGRLGGDFNSAATDSLSAEYGIHASSVYGGLINAQTEYVIRSANSVGWYFDKNCQRVRGVNGYFESNNKHHIECYGRDCVFEVNAFPSNRQTVSDFKIEGLRNELSIKPQIGDGNAFMNLTVPVGSISATKANRVENIFLPPLTASNPLNRAYAASDISNTSYWSASSPTGGTSYPTLSYAYDSTMDYLGGSFATTVTAVDTELYQYGQTIVYLSSEPYAYGGVMVRGVSGETRVMLKVTPGAGTTARYAEVVLDGSTEWRYIEIPVETDASTSIVMTISFKADAGAVCQVANAKLSEFLNGPKFFKNYSATRPVGVTGSFDRDSFENVNIYGRTRHFVYDGYTDANHTLTTVEYSTYLLPQASATRTITLPVIATAGLAGTQVTFLRGSGGGSNWEIAAGAGNTFSSGAGPVVLGATDKAITLVAFGTQWLIASQR